MPRIKFNKDTYHQLCLIINGNPNAESTEDRLPKKLPKTMNQLNGSNNPGLVNFVEELIEIGHQINPNNNWETTIASTLLAVFGNTNLTYYDEKLKKQLKRGEPPPNNITDQFCKWLENYNLLELWDMHTKNGHDNEQYPYREQLMDQVIAYALGINSRDRKLPTLKPAWNGRWENALELFTKIHIHSALTMTHNVLRNTIKGLEEAATNGLDKQQMEMLKQEEAKEFALYLLSPTKHFTLSSNHSLSILHREGELDISKINHFGHTEEITTIPSGANVYLLSSSNTSVRSEKKQENVVGGRSLIKINNQSHGYTVSHFNCQTNSWETVTSNTRSSSIVKDADKQQCKYVIYSPKSDEHKDHFIRYFGSFENIPVYTNTLKKGKGKNKDKIEAIEIRWESEILLLVQVGTDKKETIAHTVSPNSTAYVSLNARGLLISNESAVEISKPGSRYKIRANNETYGISINKDNYRDPVDFARTYTGEITISNIKGPSRWTLSHFSPKFIDDLQQWPIKDDISLHNWILSNIAGGDLLGEDRNEKRIIKPLNKISKNEVKDLDSKKLSDTDKVNKKPRAFIEGLYVGFCSICGIYGNTNLKIQLVHVFYEEEDNDYIKKCVKLVAVHNGIILRHKLTAYFGCLQKKDDKKHYFKTKTIDGKSSCPFCNNKISTKPTYGYILDETIQVPKRIEEETTANDQSIQLSDKSYHAFNIFALDQGRTPNDPPQTDKYNKRGNTQDSSDSKDSKENLEDIDGLSDKAELHNRLIETIHRDYKNKPETLAKDIDEIYYHEENSIDGLSLQQLLLLDHLVTYQSLFNNGAGFFDKTNTVIQAALRILLLVIYSPKHSVKQGDLLTTTCNYFTSDMPNKLSQHDHSQNDFLTPYIEIHKKKISSHTLEKIVAQLEKVSAKDENAYPAKTTKNELLKYLEQGINTKSATDSNSGNNHD
jgi:hypothetical protein